MVVLKGKCVSLSTGEAVLAVGRVDSFGVMVCSNSIVPATGAVAEMGEFDSKVSELGIAYSNQKMDWGRVCRRHRPGRLELMVG